jgi:uncharacterized membrane protein
MNSAGKYSMMLLFAAVFVILAVNRCYYDSEEYLFPEISNNCDTTSVTFSQTVSEILNNKCLSCHSNTAAAALGGNIKLESYADVKARADDGKLLGAITHAQGYIAMPLGAQKMDDCSIGAIQKWIQEGALNN